MRVELEIWRQDGPRAQGFFESHVVEDAEPQMSLLELLDRLNDQIIESGGELKNVAGNFQFSGQVNFLERKLRALHGKKGRESFCCHG